ncbi:MAG: hypothetical protein ACRD10_03555, partial [Terriglobia bacterium]
GFGDATMHPRTLRFSLSEAYLFFFAFAFFFAGILFSSRFVSFEKIPPAKASGARIHFHV